MYTVLKWSTVTKCYYASLFKLRLLTECYTFCQETNILYILSVSLLTSFVLCQHCVFCLCVCVCARAHVCVCVCVCVCVFCFCFLLFLVLEIGYITDATQTLGRLSNLNKWFGQVSCRACGVHLNYNIVITSSSGFVSCWDLCWSFAQRNRESTMWSKTLEWVF